MRARTLWAACVVLAGLGLAAELARPPSADMGFYLYAAGRALDGARLYRDVVEINPPLIIALNMPVVLLARATGLSEFLLYRLGTGILVGFLLGYSARLIRRYVLPEEPAHAGYLVLLLCFAVFDLARVDFGQREHFVLALLVPYVLLVGAERAGRRVSPGEAAVIGIMAGVAIALKPHFGLAWAVLEVFRRAHCTRVEWWRPTGEVAGVLGVLIVYGVAVLLLTPDYLAVARLLGPAYLEYMRVPFFSLLILAPGAAFVGFVLLALPVLHKRVRRPALCTLLAWTTAACFIAGAAQEKNFRYHFYPAVGLAFVLLGLIAEASGGKTGRLSERVYARASRALFATIVIVVVGAAFLTAAGRDPSALRRRAELADLVDAVHARAGGRPIGVLSYTMDSAFPLVNYAGVRLASRFPSMWPLAVSYWDPIETGGPLQYHAISDMAPVERFLLAGVREDLTTAQPRLLLVLRPARDAPPNGQRRLNYLRYFGRDQELGPFLAQYRLADRRGEYLLYERGDTSKPWAGPAPSAAPGTQDVLRRELKGIRLRDLDQEFVVGLVAFAACWMLMAVADRRRSAAQRLPNGSGAR